MSKKAILIIIIVQLLFIITSCNTLSDNINKEENINYYIFEGSEPFWSLEIKNNSFMFFLNEEIKGDVNYSTPSSRGETLGFKGENIYGIINKTWEGYCDYAITEKDSLNFEIIFVYNNQTFKGCGEKISN